ncbi:MAG: DUF3592 domain-containing protein [Terracidiphilus sp.]
MTLVKASTWEAATGLLLVASATAYAIWWYRRRRPTAEEMERARRAHLAAKGRVVDGMLLDVRQVPMDEGTTLTMLEYSYRIGGVEYDCSQDITLMGEIVDPAEVRAGYPCSVRYLPGSPQNSIVVAEEWSGLRATLPDFSAAGHLAREEARQQRPQTQ